MIRFKDYYNLFQITSIKMTSEAKSKVFVDRLVKNGETDQEAKAYCTNYKTRMLGITPKETTNEYNNWITYEEVNKSDAIFQSKSNDLLIFTCYRYSLLKAIKPHMELTCDVARN